MEKAVSVNISLYPRHTEAIKTYAKCNNYNESKVYQEIIDDFFTKDDKKIKYYFILYLFIPMLFCLLTTVINISTDKVFNSLLEKGLFYNDLYILSRVYMVLSFGSIGILMACIYTLRKKLLEEKEKVVYGD